MKGSSDGIWDWNIPTDVVYLSDRWHELLGFQRGDPVVGLLITLVILKITWDSWRTVRERRIQPKLRTAIVRAEPKIPNHLLLRRRRKTTSP